MRSYDSIKPKEWLEKIVSESVMELYNLKWQPTIEINKVIKHENATNHIDYSFACFELNKLLNIKLSEIQSELCNKLKNNRNSIDGYIYNEVFEFEILSGYINVKVTSKYLFILIKQSISWLGTPKINGVKNTTLLFSGPAIGQELNHVIPEKTYKLVRELYGFSKVSFKGVYIIADQSNYAAESIARLLTFKKLDMPDTIGEFIKVSVNNLNVAQMRRRVKSTISNQQNSNAERELIIQINKIRSEYIDKWKAVFDKFKIVFDETILESTIVNKVNNMLNSNKNNYLISDKNSNTTYFKYKNEIMPLRANNNLIFKEAFELFLLEKYFVSATKNKEQLIYFYSDKSELIVNIFHSMNGKFNSIISKYNFTNYDEKIELLIEDNKEIIDIFNIIAKTLNNINEEALRQIEIRQFALECIEFEKDFHFLMLQPAPVQALVKISDIYKKALLINI